MTPVQRVLATARSENGYLEKATNAQLEDKTANAGYNNWNKFAAFLDDLEVVYNGKKNGYAWCDCFVDYCFIYTFGLELGMAMTFQPKKGAGAGCTYSMGYYKKAGRFFKDPQPGDQIFFTNDGGASSYHMTDCYGNEFVPYVVLTEKMLNKIQACTYSMDIFNQVAKMTTNYCVWKKVTDYLVQCSDIIADKVENAKAQG